MPLFEFNCSKCNKKFEELCSNTVQEMVCPACGEKAGKVFSTFRKGRDSASGSAASSSSCGSCSKSSCSSC